MVDLNEIKESAVKAFGHQGLSLEDCLALRVSQLQRHSQERLEALNLNAKQAQMIAGLRAESKCG